MSSPYIRLARAGDAEAIASIIHRAFAEFRPLYTEAGFRATVIPAAEVLGRMSEGPAWLAEFAGRALGTVAAVRRAEELYIRGMAVVPSARSRGIARLLLTEAERFGRSQGLTRALLSTTPFLHSAVRLYERAGYSAVEHSEHDLSGTPLVRMEKRL
jgi:putative acetyltransferase